jgi:hypothetical protein
MSSADGIMLSFRLVMIQSDPATTRITMSTPNASANTLLVSSQLSDQLSGFGVAYPEPLFQAEHNWEHRRGVSGHRLSDGDLVLSDGSRTTLYPYLQEGPWVLLQVAAESRT